MAALQADVVVLSEYYPREQHEWFLASLEAAGYPYSLASDNHGEIANRILIASQLPIEKLPLETPAFDRQFPSNILSVRVAETGVRLLGIRIPAYGPSERARLCASWDWLERTINAFKETPAVVLGDLNANPASSKARGGEYFRRILRNGWHRATPKGASYFGTAGRCSEIDHMLGNVGCSFANPRYVTAVGEFKLAGAPDAISDHAALLADLTVSRLQQPQHHGTDQGECCPHGHEGH